MCLVILAIGQNDEYPFILAGNRDEFHSRKTADAAWWPDKPDIVGGRDLAAGGSWLTLHRNGRFATVTNFRDAEPPAPGLRSRGHLVSGFLECQLAAVPFLKSINGSAYAGFNLIVGDASGSAYLSNRDRGLVPLDAGLYGLSNALLDGHWDKVERSKRRLADLLDAGEISVAALFDLLGDRVPGPADEAEQGRLEPSVAQAITAPFIVMEEYGTRCSTVVTCDRVGRWELTERRFNSVGNAVGESQFGFEASP